MGWLEFIEKMVGHLAWPGAAITILLILRKHLGGIILALKTLKLPGGVELELYDRFKELREEAAKLPLSDDRTQAGSERDRSIQLAADFPQAAIMQSWIELEGELLEVSRAHTPPDAVATNRPISPAQTLRALRHAEILDQATFEVIDRLRHIRNQIVHAGKEVVTPGEALEFQQTAETVISQLRRLRRDIQRS